MLGSILMQTLTDWLDKSLKRRHLKSMLQQLYKQLMLLGLYSYSLHMIEFALQNFGLFQNVLTMLAVTLFIYVLLVMLLMLMSERMISQWETASSMPQAILRGEIETIKLKSFQMGCLLSWLNLKHRHRLNRLNKMRIFHELRGHFIYQHGQYEWFDFSRYLQECLHHLFVRLMNLDWTVWFTTGMQYLSFTSWMRRFPAPDLSQDTLEDDYHMAIFYIWGWGIFVTTILVMLVCYRAQHRLTVSHRYWIPPANTSEEAAQSANEAPSHSRYSSSTPLARQRDGSLSYLPPELRHHERSTHAGSPRSFTPRSSLVLDPIDETTKAGEPFSSECTPCCLCARRIRLTMSRCFVCWSRLTWAPTVYVVSTTWWLRLLQTLLFSQATYLSLLFELNIPHPVLRVSNLCFVLLPSFLTVIFFILNLLPVYSIVANVGISSRMDVMQEVAQSQADGRYSDGNLDHSVMIAAEHSFHANYGPQIPSLLV